MNCPEYSGGSSGRPGLLPRLARLVHARHCAVCRSAAQDMRRIAAALADAPRHEPPPGFREKLLSLAASETPAPVQRASRIRAKSTRWGVAAAVALALAAVLFATRGERQDALAQALDDLKNAKTVHMVATIDGPGDHRRIEFWISGGKRFRLEDTSTDKGDAGTSITVQDGDTLWEYSSRCKLLEVTEGSVGSPAHDFAQLVLYPQMIASEVRRDATDRGGVFREEQGVDERGRAVLRYVVTGGGQHGQTVFTLDAATGRLIGLEGREQRSGQAPSVVRFSPIEYDVPIPDDRFTFAPPPGTYTVVRDWWLHRRDQVLGKAVAGEWRLTLHALDVRGNGDVIVSVSRQLLAEGTLNEGGAPRGRLIDDEGRPYAELPVYGVQRGYWALEFTPVEPLKGHRPERFTVELNPYRPGSEAGLQPRPDPGVVAFDDVPASYLPPGNPFEHDEHGKPLPEERPNPERDAVRLRAIEEYHRQYGK